MKMICPLHGWYKNIIAAFLAVIIITGNVWPVFASVYTSDEAIEENRDIMAQVCMSEAGNQPMIGKVAVVVTILNRADIYERDISTVVTQADQYSLAYAGTPTDDCYKAINLAVESRDMFPFNMTSFRTEYFHDFGTPYVQIGDHFFSTVDYGRENDESSERISKLPRETAESLEHMEETKEPDKEAESSTTTRKISLKDTLGALFSGKSDTNNKPTNQIRIRIPKG